MTIEKLYHQGLVGWNRFLTPRGRLHFKEKLAGKASAIQLAELSGCKPQTVRSLLNGFRMVTDFNIAVLENINLLHETAHEADERKEELAA